MTGKERFAAVIRGEKPDKLPLFIPTVACTVASEILGRPAFTGADSLHFQEEYALSLGEAAHAEFEHKYTEDTVALARALRVDIVRNTWRKRGKPSKRLDEHTLLFGDEDGGHLVKRFFPATQSYGIIKDTNPPDTADTVIHMARERIQQPPPRVSKETALRGIAASRRIFDAIRDDNLGEIIPGFMAPYSLFRPSWLEAMALEPELLEEFLLWTVPGSIDAMEHLADAGYLWFSGGGDLASQTGPLFGPEHCKAVLSEPVRRYSAACARRGTVFSYATDGNIWKIFDELLIETGAQAFGEADRDAGMAVGRIRARSENLIVLGNTSSVLLRMGTAAQVREDTRRQLEESGGRRFIPGPSNAIVHGTPVENIFAMIEEIERFAP
jgi:hypothetical protein